MTSLTALVRRHPAAAYFALTFAISWAGVLLVIGGPSGIPGTTADNDSLFPAVLLAMLAGPSIAGPVLTGIVRGKRGCRELVARLLTWHVDVRWYAVALLTAPAIAIAVLLVLSDAPDGYEPMPAAPDQPCDDSCGQNATLALQFGNGESGRR